MKKTEIVLSIISVIAVGLNLFLIPSGSILTVLSLSSLSLIYFYFGFALFNNIRFRKIFKKESYKGIRAIRIISSIGTGFALSVTIIGILFKFQSWPGATMELSIGLFGLAIVAIIGTIRFLKTKSDFYIRIFIRCIFIGGLGLILILIPKNSIIDFKYRNHPAYLSLLKEYMADPYNNELSLKLEIEREKMNDK